MRPVAVRCIVFGFFAFMAPPGWAQFYGQDMNSYSHLREKGSDPMTQHSWGGTSFNDTLEYLQRKAEEDRRRRELQESQRRRSENEMTTTSERLLESYFSRRSYNTR